MITLINDDNLKNYPSVSYEDYDYSDFWMGRDYEDQADKIAVSKLLSMINGPHGQLIDIGAGSGRMVPLYETIWNKFVLFDSSQKQINLAQEHIHNKKAEFVVGVLERNPFHDQSFDTVLCLRTFHYVKDTETAIKEMYRILKPGGYLILEIPNKLHFKNRLSALLGKNSDKIFSTYPVNVATNDNTIFLNHNPQTILKLLKLNNFQMVKILSVSNFRSSSIKKFLPTSFLIRLEKLTQGLFSSWWFGPSIYFLVKKNE